MQKIFLSLLIGGIILLGCSKDAGNNASIVGNWKVNVVTAQLYVDNVLQGSDTTTEGTVTFESNNTYTSTDGTDTNTGTYSYNSSTKLLTVISDGDTSLATVTNLTATNLHFKQDETTISNGSTVRATADADYSRQ